MLHNKKLNVGVVKEQVGVAFAYPNIRLSAWFLESSGHCCSVNRGSTVFTKINSLAISISSSLSVKSLCQSMQLAIEPLLCHALLIS